MSEENSQQQKEDKEASEKNEEKKVLNAKETALFAFSLLEQKAWISLGLVKDADDEFHKSKDDARFLIDLLARMIEYLDKNVDEKIVDELKNQLSTLQLNFVNQFKN
ncbi:DUF1844 domain-containing protein [Mesoaciditoga sp.]